MSRNGKVIVAMSGGVDSSVAACLLKEQGYECIGVFMRVGAAAHDPQISQIDADEGSACASSRVSGGDASATAVESKIPATAGRLHPISKIDLPQRRLKHGCCSATDALDARLIAGKLGIPFYALNFEHDFGRIIDYFVDEYGRARTPNPCVMCNIHLKFGKLFSYADMMDAEFVATGHYARRIDSDEECRMQNAEDSSINEAVTADGGGSASSIQHSAFGSGPFLARAVNHAKDQSYVLFGIRRDHLPRCLFPLGGFADKAEVRRIAAMLGLRVHDKPDSQELCFVPGNDYTRLYDDRRPTERRPGEILDAEGRIVGTHAGYQSVTIGQRRGLRLALGSPVYVTRIDAATNTVVVGPREGLLSGGLLAEGVNWLVDTPTPVQTGGWLACATKIRHMHAPAPGRIRCLEDDLVEARFDNPQTAVTPGQAAVFYARDIVIGGGWIRALSRSTHNPSPAALGVQRALHAKQAIISHRSGLI